MTRKQVKCTYPKQLIDSKERRSKEKLHKDNNKEKGKEKD